MAELLDQQLRRVLVNGLGDGDRGAHLEQRLDEVGAALAHAFGELLDCDRLWHVDIAILLGGRAGLLVGALFLLAGALECGERAGASTALFATERARDGQLARLATVVGARTMGRTRRLGTLDRREAARLGPAILFLLGGRRGSGSLRGRLGGAARFLFGALAGLFLGANARFLLGPAIVLGAALLFLGRLDRLAMLAAAGLLERGETGLLGLAEQLFLALAPRGGIVDRARGRLRRRRLGGDGRRRRRRGFLDLRRFGFAGPAEDAALLHLDHDGV